MAFILTGPFPTATLCALQATASASARGLEAGGVERVEDANGTDLIQTRAMSYGLSAVAQLPVSGICTRSTKPCTGFASILESA